MHDPSLTTVFPEKPRRLVMQGATAALFITLAVLGWTAWTFWTAHQAEEAMASRLSAFDGRVWQAIVIHDARMAAAEEAVRDGDEEDLRRLRVLVRDADVVSQELAASSDLAPTAAEQPATALHLRKVEEAAVVPNASRASLQKHASVANAYRMALSVLDRESAATALRLRAARVRRSQRLLYSLVLALILLVVTWVLVIRGLARQLRARREALRMYREVNRQNRLILDATADGIVGIDAHEAVVFINPAAARLLSPIAEERKHLHVPALFGFDQLRQAFAATLLRGENLDATELDLTRDDGTIVPSEVTGKPMRDERGAVVGGVFSIRDISQRRELEQMKSEFVATVSHELRTPLTSIRGALGLISAGHFGRLADKGQRMLDIALNNTDRLVRLINDILDIERIESGIVTLNRSTFNAGALMLGTVDAMRPLAEKHGIAIDAFAVEVLISADSDRITQVLTNLIGNAIKFSDSGSRIDVGVTREDDECIFRIRDHGRGVPPDKVASIFERFQQVDSSDSREKGGTGLGLPICRSIVSLHDGKIWVESAVGVGSTFSFTIPCLSGPALVVPETTRATRGRIIVCEDDDPTREVLSVMLTTAGYEALPVRTGEEALALAATCNPDALLLDIVLPGINGWETIAQLQANVETKQIPVIVLSGLGRPALPSANIAGWIEKPALGKNLYSALDVALAANIRRVVIAEDDVDLGRVLLALFQRDSISVSLAESGTRAVELIEQTDPDLVVLDLGLPGLDGFEVFDWMRRRTRWEKTPIVIYSARELSAGEAFRLQQGPTELLVKGKIAPEQFAREALGLLSAVVGQERRSANDY